MTRARTVIAFVVAGLSLAAAGMARAGMDSHTRAPSIEKVIIEAAGPSALEGEGAPGDVVRLISEDRAIGEAKVGANRRWRVVLKEGLSPGTYRIRADALTDADRAVAGDEIRVSVPVELGGRAVVTYDGARGDGDEETRRRAETLAEGAGQAFDELSSPQASRPAAPAPPPPVSPPPVSPPPKAERTADAAPAAPPSPAPASGDTPAVEAEPARGPVAVIVDWLKRSARAYREDIVDKLAVPVPAPAPNPTPDEPARAETAPDAGSPDVSAADAARRIAEERRAAEQRRLEKEAAEKARKAEEAVKRAEERALKEEAARKKADELARRQAEAAKRHADELAALKKAREEADARAREKKEAAARPTAKPSPDAAAKPPTPVTITLEPFSLPGDKPPAKTAKDGERDVAATGGDPRDGDAVADDPPEARDRPTPVRYAGEAGRCSDGRVVHRKGRRWYITGRDDTLWDIAERFYGSGLAYPRIYRVNKVRLSSPHVVRPCLALRLPSSRRR